jgi:hypothetical protein
MKTKERKAQQYVENGVTILSLTHPIHKIMLHSKTIEPNNYDRFGMIAMDSNVHFDQVIKILSTNN